jgi:hypothetical protein
MSESAGDIDQLDDQVYCRFYILYSHANLMIDFQYLEVEAIDIYFCAKELAQREGYERRQSLQNWLYKGSERDHASESFCLWT